MLEYLLKIMQGDAPFTLEFTTHNGDEFDCALRSADAHGIAVEDVTAGREYLVPWSSVEYLTVVWG